MGAIHFGDIKDTPLVVPIVPIDVDAGMQISIQICTMDNCLDRLTGDQKKADAENETRNVKSRSARILDVSGRETPIGRSRL